MIFLLIPLLLFLNTPVSAHHEGITSGPGIAGPFLTFPARTLAKGKFFINTGVKYTNYDNFGADQVGSLLQRKERTGQIDKALVPSIGVGYGLTGNWDIYLTLPYQIKYNLVETRDGQRTDYGDSIGLGDLTVLSQYRFYRNQNIGLYSSLLAGLNVPIGFHNVRTNQGKVFGNDDQPGSGSWDPYLGLALSKDLGAFSFDTNALYRLSTAGPRNATVGDTLNYNIALSYRIQHYRERDDAEHLHTHSHKGEALYHNHEHHHGHHPHTHASSLVGRMLARVFPAEVLGQKLTWDIGTELNYIWQERPEYKGVSEDNHGGHLILATEGIRAIINDSLVTNLGVSLPLITGPNGVQATPSIPSIFINFSYLF